MHCQSENLCTSTAKKYVQICPRGTRNPRNGPLLSSRNLGPFILVVWRVSQQQQQQQQSINEEIVAISGSNIQQNKKYSSELTTIRVTNIFGANSSDQYLGRNYLRLNNPNTHHTRLEVIRQSLFSKILITPNFTETCDLLTQPGIMSLTRDQTTKERHPLTNIEDIFFFSFLKPNSVIRVRLS